MGHQHTTTTPPAGFHRPDQPVIPAQQRPGRRGDQPAPPVGTGRRGAPPRAVCPDAVELLRLAQAGDRDAFAGLYAAYAERVRRYVVARMRDRDPDAIPDLVQDTFAGALEELDRAHDDVEVWLIQLAAKMCTRHAWRQRRYLRAALSLGEHQRIAEGIGPAAEARRPQVIAEALAGLTPRDRLTVQLRFLDGHPRRVTAELMDCSEWTVKWCQRRALRQLAARLGTSRPAPRRSATR